MEFRDFDIEDKDDYIIISQTSPQADGGKESIFLAKEQLQFFIDKLTGITDDSRIIKDSFEYTAIVDVSQDDINTSICISSGSVQGLFEEKKNLFDSFIEDAEHIAYQIDNTTISNITKVKVIERNL